MRGRPGLDTIHSLAYNELNAAMAHNRTSDDAWRDIRRRRRLFLGTWLGGAIAIPFVSYPFTLMFNSESPYYVCIVIYLAVVLIARVWLSFAKCPRCGRQFSQTIWFENLFSDKCVHCHLVRYSPFNTDGT